MPKTSKEKLLDTLSSMDFLLKDLLEQIKILDSEKKEANYTKLIELFFKGIDLREKFLTGCKDPADGPQLNFIKGLDEDLV